MPWEKIHRVKKVQNWNWEFSVFKKINGNVPIRFELNIVFKNLFWCTKIHDLLWAMAKFDHKHKLKWHDKVEKRINTWLFIFDWLCSFEICSGINNFLHLKFIYSEKPTKFCEIFTKLLTTVHTVKSFAKFCGLLRIYELY